jgi:hypothetical protein
MNKISKFGELFRANIKYGTLLFLCLLCSNSYAQNVVTLYNVLDYGAKGDGITLDSPAINAAIEAADKAGGG